MATAVKVPEIKAVIMIAMSTMQEASKAHSFGRPSLVVKMEERHPGDPVSEEGQEEAGKPL